MDPWPHAPYHRLIEGRVFMLTASTYDKECIFSDPIRLDFLEHEIIKASIDQNLKLHAWAVFANHYHLVASASEPGFSATTLTKSIHGRTSREVNRLDAAPGRRVWFQYWDSEIDIETSYLARLNYVNENAVKHGLAKSGRDYKWCSARWFEDSAPRSFVRTVQGFPIDRLNVFDDF